MFVVGFALLWCCLILFMCFGFLRLYLLGLIFIGLVGVLLFSV